MAIALIRISIVLAENTVAANWFRRRSMDDGCTGKSVSLYGRCDVSSEPS